MDNKFNFNGESLPFDVLDVDFMEKYVPAEQEFLTTVTTATETDELALMRLQLTAGYAFIDKVWGAGTSDRLFDGQNNLGLLFAAYTALVALETSQLDAFKAQGSVLGDRLNRLNELADQTS